MKLLIALLVLAAVMLLIEATAVVVWLAGDDSAGTVYKLMILPTAFVIFSASMRRRHLDRR